MKHSLEDISDLVRDILATRGVVGPEASEEFLYPDYSSGLHDPFLLTDMELAVERILLASVHGQRVVVYGDYDIDGITASAVLIEGLAALGIEATSYIPDRFEEGYGINLAALQQLKSQGTDLVISVDCGITSLFEAAWAKDNGLDLIITDHHAVPVTIPDALAVINPKRPGDDYPFAELSGVGVAFKLVQALQLQSGKPAPGQEKWLLDLVALGTVCDVVPLVGENRVLVAYGVSVLRKTRRVGIVALCQVAGVDPGELDSYHLGYVLGPRLNAAGRLVHANDSLALLRSTSTNEAHEIALRLDALNTQRRAEQDRILLEATAAVEALYLDRPVLVLSDPSWSHGVVGIVASKLMERYSRPVFVMQELGGSTKGSGRSVLGYHLADALARHTSILGRHGGHHYAAGVTLDTTQVDAFRAALETDLLGQGLTLESMQESEQQPEAWVDSLSVLTRGLHDQLELMAPFGRDNRRPLLGIRQVRVLSARTIGQGARHLRLEFGDSSLASFAGIGFGMGMQLEDALGPEPRTVHFELAENRFRGVSSLQLQVKKLL
jgi:single-stranded-DNA-specific exonuclease